MKITRQRIKEIIREELLREARFTKFSIPSNVMKKVDTILRKGKYKEKKDFTYADVRGPKFILSVDKKLEDKILSLLIQKGIKNVHEI